MCFSPIKSDWGKCSLFSGVNERVVLDLPIHRIIQLIKGPTMFGPITTLMALLSIDEQFQHAKSRLLSFTPSGTFHQIRSYEHLKSRSGILVLDFDNIRNLAESRKIVHSSPFTLACFISPSGTGLKVLIKRGRKTKHQAAYHNASNHFQKITKDKLDHAEDITRLCFLSHDPEIYWNPYSKHF